MPVARPNKIIIREETTDEDIAIQLQSSSIVDQATHVQKALSMIRAEVLPEHVSEMDGRKLLAAYLLFQHHSIPQVAQMLKLPVQTIHAWLACDDDFRVVMDRFTEVSEKEAYAKALEHLHNLLASPGLSPQETMQLIDLAVRVRRVSDQRIANRENATLKARELEARMAKLRQAHEPKFTWLDDTFGSSNNSSNINSNKNEEIIEGEFTSEDTQ